MADPFWTADRRHVLRRALAKIQAGRAQGEIVQMTKEEGGLIADAAKAWEEMMTMLDERARAGDLQGLKP